MESAGRLAQDHAQELREVLRVPGDKADQVRRQLRALARALNHILCEEEEGVSDGTVAMEEEGEALSLEKVSSVVVLRWGFAEAKTLLCYDVSLDKFGTGRDALELIGGAYMTYGYEPYVLGWQTTGGGGVGVGNKRVRTSISTSTSTSTSDIVCSPRPLTTAPHASRTGSLSRTELVEHLLTFLEGGKLWAHTPCANQCGQHTPSCAGGGLTRGRKPSAQAHPGAALVGWPAACGGGAGGSGPHGPVRAQRHHRTLPLDRPARAQGAQG
jgi:hypothetical protein